MNNHEFVLANGVLLPQIAYGTFNIGDGENATSLIIEAIGCGYRQIDTASVYGNEENVGNAIRAVGKDIKREELIISSKVWNPDQGKEKTLDAFNRTCDRLGVDYLDSYLIHWPVPLGHESDYPDINYETWKIFEQLYSDKKIRAIGVSNFLPRHLKPLMQRAEIKPMINQIEIHPCYQQIDTVVFCQKNDILVQAWSPFMHGKIFEIPLMQKLARKYEVPISQICIQWCIQRNIQPIPKASSPNRMFENLGPFNFEIDSRDMSLIAELNRPDGHADFRDYNLQQKY